MKKIIFTLSVLASFSTIAANINDGWYASAFGGHTFLSSNVHKRYYGYLLTDVHYKNGYNVGASIGYAYDPLRFEFQYTFLNALNDIYRVDNVKHFRIDGGTRANIGMANVYYDLPEVFNIVSPFVGVGIGYAFMHATLNSTSRFDKPHFNVSQNSFAYQGTAGLTYNFNEYFAINALYRYTATTTKGNWGQTLQAQMGNAGIVYRFDTARYSY